MSVLLLNEVILSQTVAVLDLTDIVALGGVCEPLASEMFNEELVLRPMNFNPSLDLDTTLTLRL